MKRIFKTICIILALGAVSAPVFAQEEENDIPAASYQMNREGDKYIRVSLSPVFPLNFPNPAALFTSDRKMSIGGLGVIGYHQFITDDVIVGVDAGFGFNATIGSHIFNYVPIVGTITWQPVVGNFEFPLTMGIGVAYHTYIGYSYFPGLVLKPEVGVHYRVSPSWSVGADASYSFMPEFNYSDMSKSVMGQFFNFAVTARYYL